MLRFLNRELRAEEPRPANNSLWTRRRAAPSESEAVRARAVLDLAEALDGDLERKAAPVLDEVELPLVDVLASMERNGSPSTSTDFGVGVSFGDA